MDENDKKLFDFMVDPLMHNRAGYGSSVVSAYGRFPDAEITPELRKVIDEELEHAPTTEEGWAEVKFVFGGTYAGGAGTYERICQSLKDDYRKGVEALRARLK